MIGKQKEENTSVLFELLIYYYLLYRVKLLLFNIGSPLDELYPSAGYDMDGSV